MKPLQLDVFGREPRKEQFVSAPYQPQSPTSEEAAKRISPAFHGNRSACLKAIARYDSTTGITRKQIAEMYFDGKQNYVTGPVDALINEDEYVYQEPARDREGAIVTRTDPKTGERVAVPRRVDGSAVLRLTPKGRAATKGAA